MIKKILLFIMFSTVCLMPSFADTDKDGYAGTPKDFYEDINPNTIDENENKPITTKDKNDKEIDIPQYSSTKVKSTKNYTQIYSELELPDFSYLHGIDPDQYYDMKDTSWSIYPLLRLNSPIYFKTITIEPGYYLLTPREHNGKWYLLFKQNGNVVHIVPVYERDYTPETFYDENIPKPKLTKSQKIHMEFLDFIGNFKSTKRKAPVQSYLEINDLENYFVNITIYYGPHKYKTIFRTIKL